MTITMFDSVDTPLLPAGDFAYAGYADGRFANLNQIRARFPGKNILSIAVFARDNADCLDIETGDATPAQAAGWVFRQFARKSARPCLYASASVMQDVLTAMNAAGIHRNSLRLWSAHYTDIPHICGPSSCRQMSQDADGTQWTDRAGGINLDESLLLPDFFGTAAPPAISSLTQAQMEAIMNALPVLNKGMTDSSLPHWYIRRLQLLLHGIYGVYNGSIDGIYGPSTASAVRTFQNAQGLAPDGIAGPDTWAKAIAG
jgi:hypothetical protein